MASQIDLWSEFEYCCAQWKCVLEDSIKDNLPFAHILLLVSIRTFDREQKYMLLVHNPKYTSSIRWFNDDPVLIKLIQKYFGIVTIEFKENISIVDHPGEKSLEQMTLIKEKP